MEESSQKSSFTTWGQVRRRLFIIVKANNHAFMSVNTEILQHGAVTFKNRKVGFDLARKYLK